MSSIWKSTRFPNAPKRQVGKLGRRYVVEVRVLHSDPRNNQPEKEEAQKNLIQILCASSVFLWLECFLPLHLGSFGVIRELLQMINIVRDEHVCNGFNIDLADFFAKTCA